MAGGGGGGSNIKKVGMLVENFEIDRLATKTLDMFFVQFSILIITSTREVFLRI